MNDALRLQVQPDAENDVEDDAPISTTSLAICDIKEIS